MTQADSKNIKNLYNKAIKEGETQFMYKGTTILVSYAKYLLEFWET